MDAKPQRPRATLRTTDENMPVHVVAGGKTLHHRTKSTPALSTLASIAAVKANGKKVLGESNKNLHINKSVPKDDSEIGKVSPGKFKAQQEVEKAVRPLAAKPIPAVVPRAAPATSLNQKKSLKVLKDAANVTTLSSHAQAEPALQNSISISISVPQANTDMDPASVIYSSTVEPAMAFSNPAVQHQLVHKVESVPLRDEPAANPLFQAAHAISTSEHLPVPGFIPNEDAAFHGQRAAQLPCMQPAFTPPMDLYSDPEDDEDDDYDDGYPTFGLRNDATGGTTILFNPKYTHKHESIIAAAKAVVESTRTPEDIEDEEWDTSMVAEYSDEIFEYFRHMEVRMAPNPHYMDQQTEVQWSMRSVLIDWVVQVHQRFNLLPETLFLTVNYIDRFLSAKIVSLGKLQLVGATAIFLASKYEEVNCPTISEIIFMVDGGYSADELTKAERFMLSMLQFEMGWPGPMSFLRRISKADDYDLETRTLAKYFLEVTIMDERFVGLTPSYLAAGAHCMARLMLRKGDWTPAHIYYSNYTFSQLKKLLRAIKDCCNNPLVHHSAVYEKYTDKRFKRASTFVAGEMAKGFRLPFGRDSSMGSQAAYGFQ